MIGLDSNVLVRFVVQDDASQYKKAVDLIQHAEPQSLCITLPVVLECYWVLERLYKLSKEQLLQFLKMLLSSKQYHIPHKEHLHKSILRYELGKAQFSDALITVLCNAEGCDSVLTFDKQAETVGMVLL
ncbi:MAG: PIN domain-containing protein [Thiohalomonadales bacterium]